MNVEQLKRDLYWSYSRAGIPVMSKQVFDRVVRSGGGDPYDLALASAYLCNKVEELPLPSSAILKTKYGRCQVSLNTLLKILKETFRLPEEALEIFLLRWLELPLEHPMQELTGVLGCNKSTISKKCRKICLWLDELERESLRLLFLKLP